MREICYLREQEKIRFLPEEVQAAIQNILQVLDSEYGTDRDIYEDDGGYVLIVERVEDLRQIKEKAYIDCDDVIAEYVDKIICKTGEIYTNSLIICNNIQGTVNIYQLLLKSNKMI